MNIMTNQDQCTACKRCYPNGIVALLLVQICLFVGMVFSTVAIVDCEFIVADLDVAGQTIPSELTGLIQGTDRRRGFGFFTHEDDDGHCHWKTWHDESADSEDVEDYTETYMDWLGSDWDGPMGTAVTAAAFSVLFFVWSLVFGCVAHPKVARYIMGTLIGLVLFILQYIPFKVMDSDFCQGRNCEVGRSGGLAVAAGLFFIIAGVLCFCMRDYPGPLAHADQPTSKISTNNKNDVLQDAEETVIATDPEEPHISHTVEKERDEIKSTPEAHVVSIY